MLHINPHAEELRSEIDTVIFDIDGVLLDITQSIRALNILAVPFYLREVLGWPVGDDLLTSEDIELFKNAGGFNDDWDLTCALVLHYIAKEHENPDASPETLNVIQPTLRRYAARIQERGGWLKAAEDLVLENLTRDDQFRIEVHYRKHIIVQVCEELFAGEHCERIYGRKAELYKEPGLVNKDRPLLDVSKLPKDKNLGILTGRNWGETQIALEFIGLNGEIPESNMVTARDGFKKPKPGGLSLLTGRLQSRNALYIGDTLDDYRTVKNFHALKTGVNLLSALVLTGPAGDANTGLFKRSGADMVAADVNTVLDWLAG